MIITNPASKGNMTATLKAIGACWWQSVSCASARSCCCKATAYRCITFVSVPFRICQLFIHSFILSFIPLACAECDDSLTFTGSSSIPLSYVHFSCHPSAPTIRPSSLTSSCHLFLGLPHNLVVPKFIYNTLLGILFFSPFSVHAQTNIIYLTLLSLL